MMLHGFIVGVLLLLICVDAECAKCILLMSMMAEISVVGKVGGSFNTL